MSFSTRSNVMVVRSMGPVAVLANVARSLKRRLDCWMSARSPVPVMALIEPLEARIALSAAPAEIPGEFVVNTYTSGAQVTPSTTPLSTGGYVVTWAGPRVGGSSEIFAQIYTANSNKVGGEFQVNTTSAGAQTAPSVAKLSDDRFVIVWQSAVQDGDSWGVYGQVYNNDGTKVGAETIMNGIAAGSQDTAAVVGLATGGFMVSWESPDGSSDGVYARRFDNNGAAMASQFRVNTIALGDQGSPSIAALGDGSAVVVWTSAGQDGNLDGVYAQRYDSLGAAAGAPFQVNTYTSGSQNQPSVAALRTGGFVVTWQSNDNQDGQGTGIYAQVFNNVGVKVSSELLVNLTTQYNQQSPSIVADANGFIIVWETQEVRGDLGIYGRRFDNAGGQSSGEMSYNTLKAGDQTGPKAAVLSSNKVVVTWQSQGNDGSASGIAAVVLGPDNAVPTADGISDAGLYDESSHAIQLTEYFGDAETGSSGLTYTVQNNTNPELFTNMVIGEDGRLTFNITPDSSGEGMITIRATDDVGQFVEDTFKVTAVQHLELQGTATVGQEESSASFNLFNLFNVPLAARPYLDFTNVSAYTGDDMTKNTTLTKNTLHVDFTGEPGTGVFTIDGGVLWTIPIQGFLTLIVEDSVAPTVTSISSVGSPTQVDLNHVDVTFSEPIKMDSFDWTSMTLTRDGGPNLITESTPLTFEYITGNVYRISGFGGLDNYVGKYALTMLADGVTDEAGNGLADDASTMWVRSPSSASAPVLSPSSAVAPGSQTTGDSTPTVVGTGTRGSTVSIYEDTTLLGSAVVDSAGNYAVTLSELTNRTHTLTATASAIIDGVTYTADPVGSTDIIVSAEKILHITQYTAPRTTPVNKFIVVTSAALNLATFTVDDITLTRNGVAFSGDGITVTSASPAYQGHAYAINMPADLSDEAGTYVITVNGATILTTLGTALTNSVSSTWVNEARYTAITQIPPQTESVSQIYVTSNKPLEVGTFSPSDFTLTRNGETVTTEGISVTEAGPGYPANTYEIDLFDILTTASGSYVLTVLGSGVQSSGTPVANNISTSWINQTTFVSMTQFDTYRTTSAREIFVAASNPVDLSTLTADDFTLTYNGIGQPTTGITVEDASTEFAPNTYKVNLPAAMTYAAGEYVFTLNGAEVTSGTLPVANSVSSAWVTESELIHITQFPDPRSVPIDTMLITTSNIADLGTFSASDLVMTRNGEMVSTDGISIAESVPSYETITYTLSFPSELTRAAGEYVISLYGSQISSSGRPMLGFVSSAWTTQATLVSISQFAAPRTTPVTTIVVAASDAVDLSTATADDLVLTRNGVAIAKDGITITPAGPGFADNTYKINLPAGLTSGTGTYEMTVNGATMLSQGVPLANSLTTGWTNGVRFTGITQYTSPRTQPVTSFVVTSSQALDLATFDVADLALTRTGIPVSLAGATVTDAGSGYAPNSYLITVAADRTTAAGDYVFSVTGGNVRSVNGDPVTNDISSTWTKV